MPENLLSWKRIHSAGHRLHTAAKILEVGSEVIANKGATMKVSLWAANGVEKDMNKEKLQRIFPSNEEGSQ